jgi:hypothetical protein
MYPNNVITIPIDAKKKNFRLFFRLAIRVDFSFVISANEPILSEASISDLLGFLERKDLKLFVSLFIIWQHIFKSKLN